MSNAYQFSKNYPPIPLFSRVKNKDFPYVKVFNEWLEEEVSKRTNYQLPVIDNSKPEHLLFCISMFEQHTSPDLLNLESPGLKFAKFITILCGDNQDIWRDIIDSIQGFTKQNF